MRFHFGGHLQDNKKTGKYLYKKVRNWILIVIWGVHLPQAQPKIHPFCHLPRKKWVSHEHQCSDLGVNFVIPQNPINCFRNDLVIFTKPSHNSPRSLWKFVKLEKTADFFSNCLFPSLFMYSEIRTISKRDWNRTQFLPSGKRKQNTIFTIRKTCFQTSFPRHGSPWSDHVFKMCLQNCKWSNNFVKICFSERFTSSGNSNNVCKLHVFLVVKHLFCGPLTWKNFVWETREGFLWSETREIAKSLAWSFLPDISLRIPGVAGQG